MRKQTNDELCNQNQIKQERWQHFTRSLGSFTVNDSESTKTLRHVIILDSVDCFPSVAITFHSKHLSDRTNQGKLAIKNVEENLNLLASLTATLSVATSIYSIEWKIRCFNLPPDDSSNVFARQRRTNENRKKSRGERINV